MKSILAISTLFVAALAQSSTSSVSSSSVTGTTTASLTPVQSCLSKCTAGDVTCQAVCVGVPHPGTAQVDATTNCMAQCDQGDGSEAATDKYAACEKACVSSYIITSGTAAPTGSYSTAVIAAVSSSPDSSSSSSATRSSVSANATTSPGQAKASSGAGQSIDVQFSVSGGLLGLLLGAFAMW